MNCRQIRAQLADHSAGLPAGGDRERVEAHLTTCASCREHLDELRALDRLMAGDRVTASETLVTRVMDRVPPAAEWPGPVWPYVLDTAGPLLAALALLPALLWLALQRGMTWLPALHPLGPAYWLGHPPAAAALTLGLAAIAATVLWLSKRWAESLAPG